MADHHPLKSELSAKFEFGDELLIALFGGALQVIEKLPAASDHLQQATAAAVILGVLSEVIGQEINAIREPHDLDIGTTGVFVMQLKALGILVNDLAHCIR